MLSRYKYVFYGLAAAIFYWLADSAIDYHLSVVDKFEIVPEDITELWMRLVIFAQFVILGVVLQRHVFRLNEDREKLGNANRELRDKTAKYQALIENASDGIFLLDETGFIDCNVQGALQFGLSREQVIGHHPWEFSPERQPDGRLSTDAAKNVIQKAMAGEIQRFEWQHVHQHQDGGRIISAELTGQGSCAYRAHRDPDQAFPGMLDHMQEKFAEYASADKIMNFETLAYTR